MADKTKQWSDPDLVLDQWHKYEGIAMHFNDLLMRFRTQALGVLATVSALAGLIGKDSATAEADLPVFFSVLLIFWVAAWQLDQRYYSRLLEGAVNELEAFESASGGEGQQPRIRLSSAIENVVGGRDKSRCVVATFYIVIAFGLLVLIGATSLRFRGHGPSSCP
jgi:hypothetical protein